MRDKANDDRASRENYHSDLADNGAARTDDVHGCQVGQVPLGVAVLLAIVRRLGGYQARWLALSVRIGDRNHLRLICGLPGDAHRCGSYRQITYVPVP